MEISILAKRLRKLRSKAEISQRELAGLLNIGASTLAMYETGRREPDYDTLSKLTSFFNTSTDYLLGRTDDSGHHAAANTIAYAISEEPELLEFWQELTKREDLQLLFNQVKPMTPNGIKKVIRIIKAIENEEAMED